MKLFGLLLCVLAVVQCTPVVQEESVLRTVATNFVNCVNSDLSLCLKEHALKATERLGTLRKLKLFEGVTIFNTSPKEARSLDVLPTEPGLREKEVTRRLWENTNDIFQRSELELCYSTESDEEEESRAVKDVEEGRGKKKEAKKKLRLLIPLLLLAKAKAVAIITLSLVVMAASLYKLAVMAKIAFIVKAIAILKALLHKKHHEEEHGWVPHVEEHHGHEGWDGGWSRSKNDGSSLAYSHYQK
ncbi:uncharacterized protein LOC113514375 [Galleria mellonella]|uniref:Uncharacterized protein LOC113514375 n=1 Tax=Galleria mellonella TaxID=7137 RepID=A0A6J1WQZ1_GALME|nr:uncharacterized protein LOC113514375 [Galleria mellonella]